MNTEQAQETARNAGKFLAWQYGQYARYFKAEGESLIAENNLKSESFWYSLATTWEHVPMKFIEQAEMRLCKWCKAWTERYSLLEETISLTQRESAKQQLVDLEVKLKAANLLVSRLGEAINTLSYASNDTIEFGNYEGPESRPYEPPAGTTRSNHEESTEEEESSGPIFKR
jgi:hypothetical protein